MAKVLSLVERGWGPAREYSIQAAKEGRQTLHIVKGVLDAETRSLIRPYTGIEFTSVPRTLFRPAVWLQVLILGLTRRLDAIVVDNERSLRQWTAWARLARRGIYLIRQEGAGFSMHPGGKGEAI